MRQEVIHPGSASCEHFRRTSSQKMLTGEVVTTCKDCGLSVRAWAKPDRLPLPETMK